MRSTLLIGHCDLPLERQQLTMKLCVDLSFLHSSEIDQLFVFNVH